jgi:hypothetical protein
MSKLLLVLALAASTEALARDRDGSDTRASCSVDVTTYDRNGTLRPAQRVAAAYTPAVVLRGRVSGASEEAVVLLFDVFNPKGVRYQVLVSQPHVTIRERHGLRIKRTSRTREATLAVSASSIALTSMYGRWRVEPRVEGDASPCGRAEHFTIRP